MVNEITNAAVVNHDHVDKELDNVDKELVKGMKVYQRRGRAGHSIARVVEEDTGN